MALAAFLRHPGASPAWPSSGAGSDEDAVFFVHLRNPHEQTLAALEDHLQRFKNDPIESISLFRRILQTSRLPWPLRRLLWWSTLNLSGRRRAQYVGTFGVSVTGGLGASSLDLLTPVTSALNFGVVADDGARGRAADV